MTTTVIPAPDRQRRLERDPVLVVIATPPALASFTAFLADQYDSATMVTLAMVSAISVGVGLVRCYLGLGRRNEMPLFILYIGLVFWFYFPCLAVALEDNQWHKSATLVAIDNSHALRALVAVNLFTLIIAVVNQVPIRRMANRLARSLGPRAAPDTTRFVIFILLGIFIGLFFYVVAAGGPRAALDLMLASRSVEKPWDRDIYRGTSLSYAATLWQALLVGFCCLALAVALDNERPRRHRIALLVAALCGIAWVAIESGTRSTLAQCTVPAVALHLRRWGAPGALSRTWRTGILVLFLLAVVVAANAQRTYRSTAQLEDVSLEVKDNDYFTQTAYAFAVQEKEQRYFHNSALAHILTGPIPRVLWQDKPMFDSMFVFTYYLWGVDSRETGHNTNASIVGQYFLNWGWIGIVEIAIAIGFLIRLGDEIFVRSGDRAMARFGVLGMTTYLFVEFRWISFAFFPAMAVTLFLGALAGRSLWLHRRAPQPSRRPSPGT